MACATPARGSWSAAVLGDPPWYGCIVGANLPRLTPAHVRGVVVRPSNNRVVSQRMIQSTKTNLQKSFKALFCLPCLDGSVTSRAERKCLKNIGAPQPHTTHLWLALQRTGSAAAGDAEIGRSPLHLPLGPRASSIGDASLAATVWAAMVNSTALNVHLVIMASLQARHWFG